MAMQRAYLIAALTLFLSEAAIALFSHGGFVRHTLGDALVVALIYCSMLAVLPIRRPIAALSAFGIGLITEAGQALNMLDYLGLSDNPAARLILGATFAWSDIAAYGAGALIAYLTDKTIRQWSAG